MPRHSWRGATSLRGCAVTGRITARSTAGPAALRLGHSRWDNRGRPRPPADGAISVMAAMPEMPFLAPSSKRHPADDEEVLARLVKGRWDSIEEFLKLRFEAIDLFESKRFKRFAVAVYEALRRARVSRPGRPPGDLPGKEQAHA